MAVDCKTCNLPTVSRELVERLRSAGISYRDIAEFMEQRHKVDISHAAIQRHEIAGHFEINVVLAKTLPDIKPQELNLRTIIDHKMKIWWEAHKDTVPNTSEMREWFKLAASFAEADKNTAIAGRIRQSFNRPTTIQALEG